MYRNLVRIAIPDTSRFLRSAMPGLAGHTGWAPLTDGNRAGVLISQASLRHHMKRPWGIVCNGVLAIADPDSLEFGFVELSIFDDVVQIVP